MPPAKCLLSLYLVPLPIQTFYEDGSEATSVGEGGGSGTKEGAGPEDQARVFPMEQLTSIVGGEKPQVCKTLIHLVMADSAYIENPLQGAFYFELWCVVRINLAQALLYRGGRH